MYILVVGQNEVQRRKFKDLCQHDDVETKDEQESNIAVQYVMKDEPALLVLVEPVSPIEGLEVIPLLRRITKAPIIAVSKDDEMSTVKALMEGADFCVSHEVDEREFQARVRSLLQLN